MSNYSKVLKSIYDRNKQYPPTNIRVTDKLVLSVHVEVELYRAANMYEFLKEHSVPFNKCEFNDEFIRMSPTGRCYDNAVNLVEMFPKQLTYCEGIMRFKTPNGIFPLAHGWCCDRDGNIVDPTCSGYQNADVVDYLGVTFRQDYVRKWEKDVGYNGILDGDFNGVRPGVFVENKSLWYQQLPVNKGIAA